MVDFNDASVGTRIVRMCRPYLLKRYPVLLDSVADPGCFFPSRVRIVFIPDPGIPIKEFKYFNLSQKYGSFLNSRKYDPGCSSRILIFYPSRIPRSKRHWNPDPVPQHCF
jgi:hypothetical protein